MSLPLLPTRRRSRSPRPLTRATQPAAALALSDALRKDPALLWALNSTSAHSRPSSDRALLRVVDLLLGAVLASASPRRPNILAAATVGLSDEPLSPSPAPRGAAVVWSSPSERRAVFEGATAVRLFAALWAAAGRSAARRVIALVDAVAAAAKEKVEGGVCYQIWAVGAAEAEESEGAAGRLVREVLERVDSTGVPCCCVAFEERGEGFLEEKGFVLEGKAEMPKGAPGARVWVRWPRGI